ncbi:aminoglycoside adenylyltransferase [Halalkalibacillus sediminis]|uniref:Aminoglycoside adenylyltransferase n=1 Tax=Halalkalibacillus sediminis TaxID=2018042 RepID=A0A2I0QUB3_9BACI|nr:aminoglycoside 6-adenylyltransferase [Halalkalibacillus sediminis]PKR77690.1 aminoglycoside adenylyltransferase [Halalkalibacillus sediminis]
MRSEKEMMDMILGFAEKDERVRAVVMNGSRTNPNAKRDIFQDYDIVYVVTDVTPFTADHSWIDLFGERIVMQMPDLNDFSGAPGENGRFAYLMQFADGNRIDLTLISTALIDEHIGQDPLEMILLDKDERLPDLPPPTDRSYWVKRPTEEDFRGCCNEFWWVTPYIAKGLWRGEILYAKGIMDGPIRYAFNQMLDWKVGIAHDFQVSTGKFSSYLKDYLDEETWNRVLRTFSSAEAEKIWNSLFVMCELFSEIAQENAKNLGFSYNREEERKVRTHLHHVRKLPDDATEMY